MKSLLLVLKQCIINKTCCRIPVGISYRIISNPVSPPVQQDKSCAFIALCRALRLVITWICFHWGDMFEKNVKFSSICHLNTLSCWLPCRLLCRGRGSICKYTNHSILANLEILHFFLLKVPCKGSICISYGSVWGLFSLLAFQPGSCVFSVGGERAMGLKQRRWHRPVSGFLCSSRPVLNPN